VRRTIEIGLSSPPQQKEQEEITDRNLQGDCGLCHSTKKNVPPKPKKQQHPTTPPEHQKPPDTPKRKRETDIKQGKAASGMTSISSKKKRGLIKKYNEHPYKLRINF